MGTGTDIAIESGGITLVKGDLAGIVRSTQTQPGDHAQYPAESVFCVYLQLGGSADRGGVLYPFFGLLLSPILAAAAMSLSSVSVITNSLRLRSIRL